MAIRPLIAVSSAACFFTLILLLLRRVRSARSGTSLPFKRIAFSEFIKTLPNISKVLVSKSFLVNPDAKTVAEFPQDVYNDVFNFLLARGVSFEFLTTQKSAFEIFKLIFSFAVPVALLGIYAKLLLRLLNPPDELSGDSHKFERLQRIPKISFDDVVLCPNNKKEELTEIVDFLQNPKKYEGARLPHGILLVGPSGCGKTLLAKAVAGQAKCAFFPVTGSSFIDTFVGRGAAKVRKLFEEARRFQPSIIFIDEIDGLGKRDNLIDDTANNSEYIHTMNQLLVEIDGVDEHNSQIVVIAATNRFHAIDTALLRPGRFDRHVWLQTPNTIQEKLEILQIHCNRQLKNKKTKNLNLYEIACLCDLPGFSGADLANVVNEAVFFSLRRSRKGKDQVDQEINQQDFIEAVKKTKQLYQDQRKKI
jgi:ATP-dependent Zn protease